MIVVSRETLHRLVEELPDGQLQTAARILRTLRGTVQSEAPEVDWAELRARLEPFAEEWDSPEMAAYDDYDAARKRL